jgi:hypothetical protein
MIVDFNSSQREAFRMIIHASFLTPTRVEQISLEKAHGEVAQEQLLVTP